MDDATRRERCWCGGKLFIMEVRIQSMSWFRFVKRKIHWEKMTSSEITPSIFGWRSIPMVLDGTGISKKYDLFNDFAFIEIHCFVLFSCFYDWSVTLVS